MARSGPDDLVDVDDGPLGAQRLRCFSRHSDLRSRHLVGSGRSTGRVGQRCGRPRPRRCPRTAGHYWLAQSGGVRPRTTRSRPAVRLSLEEREVISRGLARKLTYTATAAELGRSVSTISREVARNAGPNGYRAARADRLATMRTAVRGRASWPITRRCGATSRTSSGRVGHRSRSAAGCGSSSPTTRRCVSRTRRSTHRYSCRPRRFCLAC